MSWILELVPGGTLATVGAAIAAVIGLFVAGRRSGRNSEKVKNHRKGKANDQAIRNSERKARAARRAVQSADADSMSNDPNNRDNRQKRK